MKTVSGQNQLLLTCRRNEDGVEVLRVETSDPAVFLPETLWGLPVVALGSHAFAPDQPAPEGERVVVTCGSAGDGEACDTRRIRSITLPDTLRSVGDYAFYSCAGLRELTLADSVDSWGGGVFMNCPRLDTFFLHLADGRAKTLSYLADELSRELDVTLTYPDGGEARLIFPEYRESFEENLPAKIFDYHIYGAGYPYHHCFRDRTLLLSDYDALFPALLRTEYEDSCALRLAFYRLRLPRELTCAARDGYLRFLRSRTAETLRWLLEANDSRGLAFFLPLAELSRSDLTKACELARKKSAFEVVALLLEERHRRFPQSSVKSFDL